MAVILPGPAPLREAFPVPGGALGADQPSLNDQLILARYVLLWQRVLMAGPRIARFDWHRALWGVPAKPVGLEP
jgi:hypothetical protein